MNCLNCEIEIPKTSHNRKFCSRSCFFIYNKNIKREHTEENKIKMIERANKLNTLGLENTGGRCKWYVVEGVKAQGRYELAYLLNLLFSESCLPNRCKQIKTPLGGYTPDFEFNDMFIEIKSSYTINKPEQIKRILWVSKNVKRVKIIQLKKEEVKLYLSRYNIKNFMLQK